MAGARREPAQAGSAKAGGKSLGSRCHPSRPNSCLHLLFLTRLLHRSSGPRLSLLCHSGCPPQWGLPTSLPPREEQRKEEKPCSFHAGAACTPPAHDRLLGSRGRARKTEGKWKVWLSPGKPGVQLEPWILRSQMGQQLCLLLQLREAT